MGSSGETAPGATAMPQDRYARSRAQHLRARATLAGGVATAFRAGQRPVPLTFVEAKGSHLTDLDGNDYVDYALAFGPMLLGHSPEEVERAVEAQLGRAIGVGASHLLEAELAEAICRTVPSAELCVFSNTGSEAVQVALRLARAATGRRRVIKFRGRYHGWLDSIHVSVPGHLDGLGTGGQDPGAAEALTICEWDDLRELENALAGGDVAAIIMEPVAVNGGCFLPSPGYLESVRDLALRSGAVLVFDEVITGFRVELGGAQERFGVVPDLTVLGKALGCGFPISAVCGRADVMDVASGGGTVAHVVRSTRTRFARVRRLRRSRCSSGASRSSIRDWSRRLPRSWQRWRRGRANMAYRSL
jgi:glutamate-1-semialdehyde 2,1-aminomutase